MSVSSLPRLGSQLFINRDDTPATVRQFVRQMADARLRLLRVFIPWDHVEPRQNQWTWETYDTVFAAAHEHGLGVVPTLMSVSPPGWMRRSSGPQEIGPLEDPEFIRASEDCLHRVVERWRSAPALDSWILWNEPDRIMPKTPATLRNYVEFLRESYDGDIARYNRASYRQYDDFAQIAGPPPADGVPLWFFSSRIEHLDWARFTVANVTGHLRRIATLVKTLDPVHLVHLNPHKVSQCLAPTGQSLWAEARVADFMGCSAHPVWHSTRFPRGRWPQSIAMFADLMRSCTRHPDGLFWVSELQAGTTVFSGTAADGPAAAELKQWLWESIGAGARAVVYWCFNWRNEGYEAGEWSLLGQDGRPSERGRATTEVATFLERHAGLFGATRPPAPEVLILYSEASLLLGVVEGEGEEVGNPRNRQMAADALCGAYLMAADLGREVRFIDERQLRERSWPLGARTLLVPGCTALEEGTIGALIEFAQRGGTVIADNLVAWKTPDGGMAAEAREALRELFGAELADLRAVPRDFPLRTDQGLTVPGWFTQLVLRAEDDTSVFARWESGEPAATSRPHGAGRAVRIGTAFFQRYLFAPAQPHLALLDPLLPRSDAALRLVRPSEQLRMRRLRHGSDTVAIILNQGARAEVGLVAGTAGSFRILDGGEAQTVVADQIVPVAVPVGEVRVVVFHPLPRPVADAPPANAFAPADGQGLAGAADPTITRPL